MTLGLLFAWLAALLLAALVPAGLFCGLAADLKLMPLAFGVALGHAIVLGLPTTLLFQYARLRQPVAAFVAGFAIGALPIAVITLLTLGGSTVIDGIPTWAGAMDYLMLVGGAGLLGAAGAAAFRATLAVCSTASIVAAPPRTGLSLALAAVAVLASGAVFQIPEATKDRSCHNMFRDGRSWVGARASLELLVCPGDGPQVASALEQFAASQGLQFRAEPAAQPSSFSLCNEQALVITALTASIVLHYLGDDDRWQAPARDLIAALSRSWPGKIQFRDARSQVVAWPPGLGSN